MVIVGASLAGIRAARTLRAGGFGGRLTLVGDEFHAPYDRPPLSKQVLSEDSPPDTTLPVDGDLRARWLLGRRAVGLDPRAAELVLEGGTVLPYDGLLITTGAAARGRPAGRTPPPPGVYTLRSLDDAHALRAQLTPGRRLLVVGAGFLGGEIAAAGRSRRMTVTLVEAARLPLERAVGAEAGTFVAELHREAGIDLRPLTTVEEFRTGTDGRLSGALLSDGTALAVDVAVLALGAVPATGWLRGSGLALDGGVLCDGRLRARYADGSIVPGVLAAGDVARVPQPLANGEPFSLGHWSNAVGQGITAGHNLLGTEASQTFDDVPSFWSDLHGVRIRSVGLPGTADEVRVHEMDVRARRVEISYHRAGRLVGALTVGRTAGLAAYRAELGRTPSAAA
ncbi:FAD-dependent oxidoreductase [Streptomyces pimonensis]|uniref:FAD-dependent oxidoreductase n=1 Tax=Streptomyces pimonensis TaxID=2860288 RepID=A0ABV4IUE5_9ACTN